jgi:flagellar protein FlaG
LEIKAASQFVSLAPVAVVKPVASMEQVVTATHQPTLSAVHNEDDRQWNGATDTKKTLSETELTKVTDELNNFMGEMNTDIKFAWHYKTNQLIVQVEDSRSHRILKECPAHEVLDMVARMRDYVGGLVDKRA